MDRAQVTAPTPKHFSTNNEKSNFQSSVWGIEKWLSPDRGWGRVPRVHSPTAHLSAQPQRSEWKSWEVRPLRATYHVLGPLAAPGDGHHLQLGVIGQVGESPLEREVKHIPLKPAKQIKASGCPLTRTQPSTARSRVQADAHVRPALPQSRAAKLQELRDGLRACKDRVGP